MKQLLLMCLVAGGACGGSSDEDSGDDDGAGEVGDRLGAFSIELVGPHTEDDGAVTPGHTAVLGKVYDGLTPEAVQWDTSMVSGGCELALPRVPFCSPACGASAACVADNTCQAYPTAQSVGTVRVTGVQSSAGSSFALAAIANTYQPTAATTLVYPGFAEGDTLGITASGSSFADGFEVSARGVAGLELARADALALAPGRALELAWNAPAASGRSQVHVKLDISHHGGSKGKIECDLEDTGAFALDTALVDSLLGLGAAGFPTIIVTRSSVGHAAVATGHVDLVVSSQVEVPIAVPGVQSCTADDDCAAPATCQDDLTCR